MNTMVHELGHAYDLEHFDFGIGQYNQYYYLSFFGETTSRLFERLFFHYMVQNHILENAAKEHFIDFEINDHDIILGSYLVSLLDFQEIIGGDFLYWSDEVFYQKVSEFFSDKDGVMDVLQSTADDDVSTVFTYSYGNILSLFLCDEVENVGFMKEFMEDFYQNRCELFQGKMLEKWGITFDRYRELHKKDIQLIKK